MTNGRTGLEPVLLLGVSVLQFLGRVQDRQAAELVNYHIGWKYALAQELDGKVLDATVLARFRERLDSTRVVLPCGLWPSLGSNLPSPDALNDRSSIRTGDLLLF